VQLVSQPGTGEVAPALAADAFGHQAGDEIAKVLILKAAANVVARLQVAHGRQHLRRRPIARHVNPVVARQAGMMAKQIAHRDPVGRNSVMQAKFRDVIPDRLLPIKTPLVHQKGEAR
jgi:hypothetical protein